MTIINLLALDTSANNCSVALSSDDKILQVIDLGERQHTRKILPQIQQLLDQANLTLSQLHVLAFAAGPGSFTGIRLAASLIQGLAFGAHLPVVPISTLQTIAQGAYIELGATQIAVAVDAYGGKIYWGIYELGTAGQMLPTYADSIASPEQVKLPQGKWVGVGNGWSAYSALASLPLQSLHPLQTSTAQQVASLAITEFKAGRFVSATEAFPIYLYGAERWLKPTTLPT